MAEVSWKERIIQKPTAGVTDEALFLVPAGCTVVIEAVRVTTAYTSGTLDIVDGTTSAAGTNILMATAAVAPTATGLKGNSSTGIAATAGPPGGFLFTTAGAVWTKGGTLVGATGRLTVYAMIRKVEPGEGEP